MSGPALHRGIHLLAGPVQGGKTTFAGRVVRFLEARDTPAGGFLCPGWFTGGVRAGFHLVNIRTGERVTLAGTGQHPGWIQFRRFWFNPEAFTRGEKWIREAIENRPPLLLVDEVGPMELEGGGWCGLLDELAGNPGIRQLWIVRLPLAEQVALRWDIPRERIFRTDRETPERFSEMIH